MPFNVACGHCLNCEEGRSAFCTEVNPGFVSLPSSAPFAIADSSPLRPEGKFLYIPLYSHSLTMACVKRVWVSIYLTLCRGHNSQLRSKLCLYGALPGRSSRTSTLYTNIRTRFHVV